MSSKRKDKKADKPTTGKRSRAKTLNFSRRNMEKYAKKSPPEKPSNTGKNTKVLEAERKRLEQERRRLENDKRQLKNAKNKLDNESSKLLQSTKKKSTKDLRLQQEVDDYKAEIEELKKYKKQMTALKKQQSKFTKKDGSASKNVRYVFAENIAEITVGRGGVHIRYDGEDEEQLHKDVRVVLPQHLLDNEQLATYMMNELQERLEDVRHIQSLIGYKVSADIEQYVRNEVSKRHLSQHTNFNPFMVNNNKLWRYALLQKKEATDQLFQVWLNAQSEIQQGQQPQICVEHGVVLQNLHRHREQKLDMTDELNRAMTGRRFQKEINLNTHALEFLRDHDGAYEYDEDNDAADADDVKQPPLSLLYAFSGSSVSHTPDTPASPQSTSRSEDPTQSSLYPQLTLAGDGNAQYRSLMQTIVVDEEQTAELTNMALFLDLIMAQQVKTRKMFTGESGDSGKRIVQALFDGVVFGQLLNLIHGDSVDVSMMQQPQQSAEENVTLVYNTMYAHNLISSWIDSSDGNADATAVKVLKTNPLRMSQYYLNAHNTVSVLLSLGACLIETWFNAQFNVRRYPQLIRLCQNDDEIAECRHWSYQTWLQRWLWFLQNPKYKYQRNLSQNKRSLKHSIDLKDHLTNGDLTTLAVSRSRTANTPTSLPATPHGGSRRMSELAQISESEKEKTVLRAINVTLTADTPPLTPATATGTSSSKVSSALTPSVTTPAALELPDEKHAHTYTTYTDDVIMVHEILNLPMSNVEYADIYPRSRYVKHLILIRVFERKNNIDALSEKEKQKFNNVTKDEDEATTTSLLAWINWMNALHSDRWSLVSNLQQHLSDGLIILHLLDVCKHGVVDWTNNVKQPIRSSKDKSVNCKEIIAICEQLQFKVVGIDESVLVAGNKKYIVSLLKQIRTYYLTASILKCLNIQKTPSEIHYLDALVLKWSNAQFAQFRQNHAHDANIVLFGDENDAKALNTLRDASLSDCIYCLNVLSSVDEKFVNYQFVQKNNDEQHKIQNASYLITVIRKLGFNVFVSPQSIVQCQYDAVLNIFCCIVNIALRQQ